MRAALVLLLLLAGCTPGGPGDEKLTVLATSELADLGPVLADLRRDTGVELVMDYRGTMAATAELNRGFDLAWLSTSRFLRLRAAEPALATSIMLSPLVLGVKASQAAKLGAPGYHCLTVTHPIWCKGDDELRALARAGSVRPLSQRTRV